MRCWLLSITGQPWRTYPDWLETMNLGSMVEEQDGLFLYKYHQGGSHPPEAKYKRGGHSEDGKSNVLGQG